MTPLQCSLLPSGCLRALALAVLFVAKCSSIPPSLLLAPSFPSSQIKCHLLQDAFLNYSDLTELPLLQLPSIVSTYVL